MDALTSLHNQLKRSEKMYKVNPFIWHDLSEKETFFQTKLSSIIITNKNLVRMLKDLEKNEVINFE
ncbi:McbB family protein, partial [Enterococcus faecalis]|nr:McbB family protein [Enterococcus faecalis]